MIQEFTVPSCNRPRGFLFDDYSCPSGTEFLIPDEQHNLRSNFHINRRIDGWLFNQLSNEDLYDKVIRPILRGIRRRHMKDPPEEVYSLVDNDPKMPFQQIKFSKVRVPGLVKGHNYYTVWLIVEKNAINNTRIAFLSSFYVENV